MIILPLDGTPSGAPATAFEPDAPLASTSSENADAATAGFGSLVDALQKGTQGLQSAEKAENAFIKGTGGLQEMMFERAKADVLVSIATAASSRVAQSLNSLTQMQL
jgi:flagellar hook-basal body complex protein FliE